MLSYTCSLQFTPDALEAEYLFYPCSQNAGIDYKTITSVKHKARGFKTLFIMREEGVHFKIKKTSGDVIAFLNLSHVPYQFPVRSCMSSGPLRYIRHLFNISVQRLL